MRALLLAVLFLVVGALATGALFGVAYRLADAQQVGSRASSPLVASVRDLAADCAWKPGQPVAVLVATGGNGKPITWALTGDTADFVLSTTSGKQTNLLVGPKGIDQAKCGTAIDIGWVPTQ